MEKPIESDEDNASSINIAKYGNLTKRSKYIELHYHFVNKFYERKGINIIKLDTGDNLADILQKH